MVGNSLHNIPTESQKLTAVSQMKKMLAVGEVVAQDTNVWLEMPCAIHVTG